MPLDTRRMTKVVVDGLIYESQAFGGISRLWSEILPRMCALDDSLRVILLTCGRIRRPPPEHAHLRHRPILPIDEGVYLSRGADWRKAGDLAFDLLHDLFCLERAPRCDRARYDSRVVPPPVPLAAR